jgi:hypothetical protein
MKGHTGRIRTTTTIAKAGNVTKGIGTTRTTTTAIGATMIMGGGIAITKTATSPVMRLTKIVAPLRLGVPHAIPQPPARIDRPARRATRSARVICFVFIINAGSVRTHRRHKWCRPPVLKITRWVPTRSENISGATLPAAGRSFSQALLKPKRKAAEVTFRCFEALYLPQLVRQR